ncbi:hypothetical protein L6V77_18165 [Myxococcota bacterium]|nr:hypothetical protein [Myxococcota bacterium]
MAAKDRSTGAALADRLREVFGTGSDSWTPPPLNTRQRVVLVAEEFDPQTLDVCRRLALQGVGIYCWSFVYHTGRAGEEFLAVERLTWSARGDEASPGARAEAPKRTRAKAEMLAALDALLKGEVVARLVADGRLEGGRPFYLYAGKCFITEVWVEGAGPVGLHFWLERTHPPRGPDVMWYGRQWNRRRTAPRVEALLSHSKSLTTALEAACGTVECQPTGFDGYPKWIVRGHVGEAAHAYEPAWIVENVEAALRAVSAAVPFTARPDSAQ